MAVWVDTSGSDAYYSGGFACDMGPYTGPWPLLPPGELTGLTPSDEIDFVVTLPNPTDPTDVTIVGDYSYDTPLWDAWRYPNSSPPPDSFFGYYGDSTGPSSPFPIPSAMPTGAHLYVVAYTSAAPSNPPEFYVPASYATGGAAAVETAMGHWSDVQAGFTRTGAPSSRVFSFYGNATHDPGGTSFDAHDQIDNAVADLRAQSSASWAGPNSFAASLVGAEKTGSGQALAQASSHGTVMDGSAALYQGPNLTGLDTWQTPYIDENGNPGQDFEFEAASPLSVTLDGSMTVTSNGGSIGSYFGFGGAFSGTAFFDFKWDLFALPLTSTTVPAPPDMIPEYLGVDYIALETSGAGAAAFGFSIPGAFGAVGGIPAFMRTGHAFAPDMSTGTDYVEGSDILPNVTSVAWNGTYPPWRYWIPGDVVPAGAKWHTVAGSWASISGAPMAIFTPGLGPVEYADGLA